MSQSYVYVVECFSASCIVCVQLYMFYVRFVVIYVSVRHKMVNSRSSFFARCV